MTVSRPSTGTSVKIAGSGVAVAAAIVAARRRQAQQAAAEERARRNAILVLAGLLLVALLASGERRRRRRRGDEAPVDAGTPEELDNSLGERVQAARATTAPSADGAATVASA
jgi:hypothetical protein